MASIAFIVFAVIIVAILLGYPVAIALGGVSLVAGYVFLGPAFMQFLPSRLMGVFSNYVLLAVPMFILMGLALQRSGLAAVLMRAAAMSLGRTPGGLGLAVLGVGAMLAASTGIVGASVVTLALIALPVMDDAGYPKPFSAGVVASAGTLGQIIPPSIVLVLLGSVMQISVGNLFSAALIPSAVLVGAYALICVGAARFGPPRAHRQVHEGQRGLRLIGVSAKQTVLGIGGPLLLIVLVLGSILVGAASPTEASGVGAVLALGLMWAAGNGSVADFGAVGRESLRLTSMVYLILFGATTFALVFRGLEGDVFLVEWVTSAGLDQFWFVVVLMIVVFLAGFFIDFIEIIFIVVPVCLPLVKALGIDPLWFSILLAVNLQTSFLTPPFGFSLFYLKGAAPPDYRTADIYRGVAPFVGVQLALVLALLLAPEWFGFGG